MLDNEAVREYRLKWMFDAAVQDRCPELFWRDLNACLMADLDPYCLSISRLFEEFVPNGRDVLESWNPESPEEGCVPIGDLPLMAFGQVVGSMLHAVMLKAYTADEFRLAKTVRHISSKYNGMRIPGIDSIGNTISKTFDTSLTTKRGLIVELSIESLVLDGNKDAGVNATETLLNKAKDVGRWFAANKESRIADAYLAVKEGQAYRYVKGDAMPADMEREIARSVVYLENWPLCLIACPYDAMSEFRAKDTVVAFKASERGAAQVMTSEQADAVEREEIQLQARLSDKADSTRDAAARVPE